METAATTNDSRSLSCAAECCVPVSISSEVLECRPAARLYLTELRRSPTTHRPRLRLANRLTPPLTLRRQRARPSFRTRGTLRCHRGRRAKRAEPGSIYPGGADGTRRVCQCPRGKWSRASPLSRLARDDSQVCSYSFSTTRPARPEIPTPLIPQRPARGSPGAGGAAPRGRAGPPRRAPRRTSAPAASRGRTPRWRRS